MLSGALTNRSPWDAPHLAEFVGRTVCPPPPHRKIIDGALVAVLTGARWAELAIRNGCALTFPALQTIVSYNCLKGNSLLRGTHGQRSNPHRDPCRRRAALRRPWLRRRHAARHRG